jgi:hypothetical protein
MPTKYARVPLTLRLGFDKDASKLDLKLSAGPDAALLRSPLLLGEGKK